MRELIWLAWPSWVEGTEVCNLIRNSLRCKHLVFWARPRRVHEVNRVLCPHPSRRWERPEDLWSRNRDGKSWCTGLSEIRRAILPSRAPFARLCTPQLHHQDSPFPALNRSVDTSYRWMANRCSVSLLLGPQGSWSFSWKEHETEAPKTAQDLRYDGFRTPPQMDFSSSELTALVTQLGVSA